MYSIEEDPILVIAAAHQHRKPGYWVGKDEIIIGSSADAKKTVQLIGNGEGVY